MSVGLTKLQSDCLRFISARTREAGVAPSYDEMRAALDLTSKSQVYRLVGCLQERGWLRRMPGHARAIEVTRSLPGQETLDLIEDIRALDNDAFEMVAKALLAEGQRRSGGRA